MTYRLEIEQKAGYLHAIVTGQNSIENVTQYIDEVRRECTARGCFRVLIEERLEGPRLGASEIFQIVSRGSRNAPGTLKAIAYVDANAEGGLMQFAETVAVNRGLPVAVFSTVAEAEAWLTKEDPGSAGPG